MIPFFLHVCLYVPLGFFETIAVKPIERRCYMHWNFEKKISKKTKPYKTIANNCWRSPFQPLKGHLTIPKRSPRIATQDTFAQPGRGTGHKWTSNTCEAVRVAADADPKSLGFFSWEGIPYLLGALQVRFFMISRYKGEQNVGTVWVGLGNSLHTSWTAGFSRLAGQTPWCQRRMNIDIWWIRWDL